ncbi:MAG: TetR/AcrR family transcriptional regulator [Hyphomicrobiaceae bacterium]
MSNKNDKMVDPQAPRRGAGRPRGATADRTREEILEGALEAFADAGYEAMSVRELARRVGVSHNLVHHHFGAKPEVWQAAVKFGLEASILELVELLEKATGLPSPEETLRIGLRRTISMLARRPAIARIIADEAGRGGERLDYIYDEFIQPGLTTLERFLGGAQGNRIHDVDSRMLALFVASVVSAPFTHGALAAKLGVPRPKSERAVERYAETLVDLMLGGIVGD